MEKSSIEKQQVVAKEHHSILNGRDAVLEKLLKEKGMLAVMVFLIISVRKSVVQMNFIILKYTDVVQENHINCGNTDVSMETSYDKNITEDILNTSIDRFSHLNQ